MTGFAFTSRWTEPRETHQREWAGLACVFAELTEHAALWEKAVVGVGMKKSPLMEKARGEARQQDILEVLKARFGEIPEEVQVKLEALLDPEGLRNLLRLAARCDSLASFHQQAAV
jgi:hypothetical protein